jgi:HlyD family secretion protein
VIAGALAWFAWPRPIAVDLAPVTVGPVRHVYTVSAPVAGKVLRTPRHVGDEVIADETVVAAMEPQRPAFHDVRSHEELQGVLAASEAAARFAEAEITRIEAALAFSRGELQRAQALARTDAISARALDKARLDVATNEAALASAKAQLEVRRSERASAAARLGDAIPPENQHSTACCIRIRAPVTGRVLRIPQESETVVEAGTPLIEIGDPRDLEIVADLLSSDAVQVRPGAPVRIDGWGHPHRSGRFYEGFCLRHRRTARKSRNRPDRLTGDLVHSRP